MRKALATLAGTLFTIGGAMANDAVQVNTNHVIVFPTDFTAANGIALQSNVTLAIQ